mmetsp:Transcript_48664/g.114243  ORF Transcript_48664/g.114243 Transcript_48664/m.114243 type:complete len:360 (+) Transcript_48664:24-1103(+)
MTALAVRRASVQQSLRIVPTLNELPWAQVDRHGVWLVVDDESARGEGELAEHDVETPLSADGGRQGGLSPEEHHRQHIWRGEDWVELQRTVCQVDLLADTEREEHEVSEHERVMPLLVWETLFHHRGCRLRVGEGSEVPQIVESVSEVGHHATPWLQRLVDRHVAKSKLQVRPGRGTVHPHRVFLNRVAQHAHSVQVLVLLPLAGEVLPNVRRIHREVARVEMRQHLAVERVGHELFILVATPPVLLRRVPHHVRRQHLHPTLERVCRRRHGLPVLHDLCKCLPRTQSPEVHMGIVAHRPPSPKPKVIVRCFKVLRETQGGIVCVGDDPSHCALDRGIDTLDQVCVASVSPDLLCLDDE